MNIGYKVEKVGGDCTFVGVIVTKICQQEGEFDMRTSFQVGELRGLRCVRFVAVINKSKKLGITKRYQKTWSCKTVAPEYTLEEMKSSFEANAKRWEEKVMGRIKNGEAVEVKQVEIL